MVRRVRDVLEGPGIVTICWCFHASSVPADSELVQDKVDRLWERAGTRIWRSSDGATKHEGWVLRVLGPVRCPVELSFGLPLNTRNTPHVPIKVGAKT
jgi:hypothetical protein